MSKLYDLALQDNVIAFIPNASEKGRTYSHLIETHCAENKETNVIGDTKRLVAFLAPTKALIKQHMRYLRSNSASINVRAYTGECCKSMTTTKTSMSNVLSKNEGGGGDEGGKVNIMSWGADMWRQEAAEVDVLLLTPDILRHAFSHRCLSVCSFSLVIIDECQNAVGRSSLAMVCDIIKQDIAGVDADMSQSDNVTRIFGMFSSPITIAKNGSLVDKLRRLESTMNSRIIVSTECQVDEAGGEPRRRIAAEWAVKRYATHSFGDRDGRETASSGRESPPLPLIDVLSSPLATLSHACRRLARACSLADLCTVSCNSRGNSHSCRTESSISSRTRAKTAGSNATSLTGTVVELMSHQPKLRNLKRFMIKITSICEDSGVLCALFAMKIFFSSNCGVLCGDDKDDGGTEDRADLHLSAGGDDDPGLLAVREDVRCGPFPAPSLATLESLGVGSSNVVMIASIVDVFTALVVMVGPVCCQKGLRVLEASRQKCGSRDKFECLLDIVSRVATGAAAGGKNKRPALSFRSGSVEGVLESVGSERCEKFQGISVQEWEAEICFVCGCLLDCTSSFLDCSGETCKGTPGGQGIRDKRKSERLQRSKGVSCDSDREEQMGFKKRKRNHTSVLSDSGLPQPTGLELFPPLMTDRIVVLLKALGHYQSRSVVEDSILAAGVDNNVTMDVDLSNNTAAETSRTSIVFVKDSLTASSLNALFFSLPIPFPNDNSFPPWRPTPLNARLDTGDIVIRSDEAVGKTGQEHYGHIICYDASTTDETIRLRLGYATDQSTVTMLCANTLEGDLQAKAFYNLQQQLTSVNNDAKRSDAAHQSFMRAVSDLRKSDSGSSIVQNICGVDSQGASVVASVTTTAVEDAKDAVVDAALLDMATNSGDGAVVAVTDQKKKKRKRKKRGAAEGTGDGPVCIKLIPDCLMVPSHVTDNFSQSGNGMNDGCGGPSAKCDSSSNDVHGKRYNPVFLHFYALCTTVSGPDDSGVQSCGSCSSHLEAANACGIAFLEPLPSLVLDESMSFYLRGSCMNAQLEYLGTKRVNAEEMLAMQLFHRSIICWETDGNVDVGASSAASLLNPFEFLKNSNDLTWQQPIPAREWAQSSHSAWYLMFPLKNRASRRDTESRSGVVSRHAILAKRLELEKKLLLSAGNEWLWHLKNTATDARMLVEKLYHHQYRRDKVIDDNSKTVGPCSEYNRDSGRDRAEVIAQEEEAQMVKYPLLHPHSKEDLVGKLFSRDKDTLYVGVEDITWEGNTGPVVTFDDVMKEGKTVSEGNGHSEQDTAAVTYLQYFISKGRMTEAEANELRSRGGHALIRAAAVPARLSLIQILSPSSVLNTSTPEGVRSMHHHTALTHLLPSQCSIFGPSVWFFCGLVLPSVFWRIQGLLMAAELRSILSKTITPSFHIPNIKKRSMLSLVRGYVSGISIEDDIAAQGHIASSSISPVQILTNSSDDSSPPLPLPSMSCMLAAMTPRLALEIHDSERLEFLGDTVLKMVASWAVFLTHPAAEEGFLTEARTALISNSFLAKQARNNDLVQYLRALPFSTGKQELLHCPSGMRHHLSALPSCPSMSEKDQSLRTMWNQNINKSVKQSIIDRRKARTNEQDQILIRRTENSPSLSSAPSQYGAVEVRAKVLADMVEAFVGSFYLSGGIELALKLLRSLNIWPESCSEGRVCDNEREDSGHVMPGNVAISLMLPRPTIDEIETSFLYTFRDPLLLQEALTCCPSASSLTPNSFGSYQRLEFLGDGVLDLAIIDMLYRTKPTASVGELTDIKCSLINNKTLARRGIDLNLHKYIITSSLGQASCLKDIAKMKEVGLVRDEVEGGKVLADVVEAIIGAVFMDCEGCLSTVQRVVRHAELVPPHILL